MSSIAALPLDADQQAAPKAESTNHNEIGAWKNKNRHGRRSMLHFSVKKFFGFSTVSAKAKKHESESSLTITESTCQKSLPQRLYSTYHATIAIHACQTRTVQEKKVSLRKIRRTLHDDMEQLSITGRRLNLSFVRSLEHLSLKSLTQLVLNRNQLYRDPHVFRRLLQGLPDGLQELSLCWNGLDAEGAVVLSGRLRKLENLKSISLSGNPIGPRGTEALIEIGNLHHVANVNLSDCDVGDEGVATLGCYLQLASASTETINLDMNSIGDVGLKALASGLKRNSMLKSLDLYCNDFGNLGIQSLMCAIRSPSCNLESLSLRANRINDEGAKIVADYLNATSLRKLNIGYNEIGDAGALCLANCLKTNNTLKQLTMSWNLLGNKSIAGFASALASNQSLEVCELDDNTSVDRRGASSFVKTLETNQTLKSLKILDRSYENHLLNDKLDFKIKANKYGLHRVGDISIPLATWPLILQRVEDPEYVNKFLRERPDILCNPVLN